MLWRDASRLVGSRRLSSLTSQTLREIRNRCKHRPAAYAWSGGKDSLVLEHLCRRAGVAHGVMVITDLEYPAFLRWVTDAMPPGLTVIRRPLDLRWLSQNPF